MHTPSEPYLDNERQYGINSLMEYLEGIGCKSATLSNYVTLNSTFIKVRDRKYIYSPLSREKYFYYIVSGAAQSIIKEKGKSITIRLMGSNSIFKIIKPEQYVQAIGYMSAIILPYDDLIESSIKDNAIYKFTNIVFEQEANDLLLGNIVNHIKPLRKRLQYFFETHNVDDEIVPLKYIASYLGMSMETLSRIRSSLKKEFTADEPHPKKTKNTLKIN